MYLPLCGLQVSIQIVSIKFFAGIFSLKFQDSGIYMCVLYPDCPTNEYNFVITKITAVTVDTQKPIVARKTTTLQLLCNGPILEFVYTDLHQIWILNDFPYTEYLAKELADVS